MPLKKPYYISASRRCDLPRFGTDAFFEAWRNGSVTYQGGYGRVYTVSLRPEDVAGYVFWSKDFTPFVNHPDFVPLWKMSNMVFHYTINAYPPRLEPGVAALDTRLETLMRLVDCVGPQRVVWRFDPLCQYRTGEGQWASTDGYFFDLLPRMQAAGITRCIFSFMTDYVKTRHRSVLFRPFEAAVEDSIVGAMMVSAAGAGIVLNNCCNSDLQARFPGLKAAHCIDNDWLAQTDKFGIHRTLAAKPTRPGCGCFESRDIGSYLPACAHGCRYCYARPVC